MKSKLSNKQLVENWFEGKYATNWHRGKNVHPVRSPELEKYLLEKWLPDIRNGMQDHHALLVARWMNDLWIQFENRDDKPWLIL